MLQKQIENITQESFTKYGKVLNFTPGFEGKFEVIVREPNQPWRLAVLTVKNRTSTFMENHPESMESFEPVRGTTLLLVAENQSPADFEVFLLDKPVCLYKGIWHDVVALSEDILIRIAENHDVTSVFYHFEKEFRPVLLHE
jgi:ureidoglycolate hydrolase